MLQQKAVKWTRLQFSSDRVRMVTTSVPLQVRLAEQ
jgi:hypothetical protein